MCDWTVGGGGGPGRLGDYLRVPDGPFFFFSFLAFNPLPRVLSHRRRRKWLARFDIVSSAPYSIYTACRTPPPPRVITLDPSRSNTPPYTIQHNSDPKCIFYYGIIGCIKIGNCSPASRRYKSYCLCRPTITVRFSRSWFLHVCIVFIYIMHFALYHGSSSCGCNRRHILNSSEAAREQTATAAAKGCAYYYNNNISVCTQNTLVFI